jgi:hypothetical protein
MPKPIAIDLIFLAIQPINREIPNRCGIYKRTNSDEDAVNSLIKTKTSRKSTMQQMLIFSLIYKSEM